MNPLRARSPLRCGRACVAHRRRSHSSRLGTGARCGQCPGGDCDRSGRHHGLQRSRSKRGVTGRKRCARYGQSRARHQAATPQRVGRFRTGGDRLAQLPGRASRISSHGYDPSLQLPWLRPLSANWTAALKMAPTGWSASPPYLSGSTVDQGLGRVYRQGTPLGEFAYHLPPDAARERSSVNRVRERLKFPAMIPARIASAYAAAFSASRRHSAHHSRCSSILASSVSSVAMPKR